MSIFNKFNDVFIVHKSSERARDKKAWNINSREMCYNGIDNVPRSVVRTEVQPERRRRLSLCQTWVHVEASLPRRRRELSRHSPRTGTRVGLWRGRWSTTIDLRGWVLSTTTQDCPSDQKLVARRRSRPRWWKSFAEYWPTLEDRTWCTSVLRPRLRRGTCIYTLYHVLQNSLSNHNFFYL